MVLDMALEPLEVPAMELDWAALLEPPQLAQSEEVMESEPATDSALAAE